MGSLRGAVRSMTAPCFEDRKQTPNVSILGCFALRFWGIFKFAVFVCDFLKIRIAGRRRRTITAQSRQK